jgi:hypothetical protein
VTAQEALEMLDGFESDLVFPNQQWKPNPSLTVGQAFEIVYAAVVAHRVEEIGTKTSEPLSRLMERSVYQVVTNQKRPLLSDGKR